MDHLPTVVGTTAQPFLVPLLCDPHSFDGGSFDDFPTRRGYQLVLQDGFPKFILNADGSRLNSKQLANIAQAWLFFGLLAKVSEISGISIDVNDFIHQDGSQWYVSTRSLSLYLDRWESGEPLLDSRTRKEQFREQQRIIILAVVFRHHQISDNWFHDGDSWRTIIPPLAERYKLTLPLSVEVSFCVLENTLDRASRRRRFGNKPCPINAGLHCKGLIERLHEDGWCPSETSLILHMFEDTSTFFASRLARLGTKANHSTCTTNKCLAFNVNTEDYRTHHTSGCKGCNNVSIDHDQLNEMLRLNKIPRARVDFGVGEAETAIALVDSGPYVAISHVWSDGLGNATANALPSCQLLRIGKMLLNLGIEFDDGNPALWIDSLLVPVKKSPEKRLALNGLSRYYTEAAKVLVLDEDLLQVTQYCSQEEQMTRIFFCTWMRRLWTLEEGSLSRDRLAFQFRDGRVSMEQLMQNSASSFRLDNIGSNVHSALQIFLPEMTSKSFGETGNVQSRFETVIGLLPTVQYRSTTKAADEPVCISHILQLDPSTLTCLDEADLRMKELIRLLAARGSPFSRRLLFTNEPKLHIKGFRWAPASFMAFEREDVEHLMQSSFPEDCAYSTDEGLLVDGIEGFLLDFNLETFQKIIFVENESVIYALTPIPIGVSSKLRSRFWSIEQQEEVLNTDPARQWTPACRNLLGKSPRRTFVIYKPGEQSVLLVCVHLTERLSDEENDFLYYAESIGLFFMQELRVRDQNHAISNLHADEIKFTNPDWDFGRTEIQMQEELIKFHNPATSTFLHARPFEKSQRWCIG
ncbi:MAG: hypothetical protein Q9195_004424 [Heterodermia aff. obscurata]